MSVQDSTFRTTHVMDNEIIKANDFEFAFEQLVENVSKATQMLMESNQDFVINGKVIPATGMNVSVSPIYGVCKSTGKPFGRTETTDETIGFAGSESGRVDIIEVQGDWETYDNQQRAFNDPDTDTQTYQYVDTKKLMKPVYRVIQGVEGAGVAPEVEAGWVKLAEVSIRAGATSILATDIHNITADVAGLENEDWTNQEDITYNIGYISDVNARFRVQHEEDGTHSENSINAFSLDIGTGANQINGNILPVGGAVSIPTQTIASTDSILSVIVKAAAMITSLYNGYLQYGEYGFKGELKVSDILDANDDLSKPISISAAGDGTAVIKIDGNAVLSIDVNGKLSTNGYTASSNNHIVTKIVTDGLKALIDNLDERVTHIEETSDTSVYTNGVLSSGTDGRYNVDPVVLYAATTTNITLSGSQAIDGTSPAEGSFILVKNQTDTKENGIYQYASGSAWTRHNDFLDPIDFNGKIFDIVNGTTNGGKMFYTPRVFVSTSTFSNTGINFSEYFGSVKPLANKLVMRDSVGRVKTAASASNNDAVNRGEFATSAGAMARMMFDYVWPIGSVYTQYPGQLEPNSPSLWGNFSTWEELNYGGAFFRANGGNADIFEKGLAISSMNGTTIVFMGNHNLAVGSVIYDYEHNEGRVVTSVTNATTVVINTAFTSPSITNVYIGQPSQNRYHSHTHSHTHGMGHRHSYGTCYAANGEPNSGSYPQVGPGHRNSTANYSSYTSNSIITSGTTARTNTDGPNDSNTSYNGNSTNQEARSENFTYKIWVRIA